MGADFLKGSQPFFINKLSQKFFAGKSVRR